MYIFYVIHFNVCYSKSTKTNKTLVLLLSVNIQILGFHHLIYIEEFIYKVVYSNFK